MIFRSAKEEIAWELERGGSEQANLTVDEVFALIDAGYGKTERDGLIMRTLYATATRVAEFVDLRFFDLEHSKARVFVRQGKGSKDRYTLMDFETSRRLQAWQGDRPDEDHLFEIGDRQVNRIVKEAGEKTGILAKYEALGQTLSPHTFRHAYATHCYESGIDLFALKELLGHTYLETTRIYVNVSLERCRDVYMATSEV